MHFNFPFILNILLVSAVLVNRRQPKPEESHHQHVERGLSTHMAGAILNAINGSYYSIHGSFAVPTAWGPMGSSAAVWVGIGIGDGCDSLSQYQTIIQLLVVDEGQSCTAWFGQYPQRRQGVSNFSISVGDIVCIGVAVSSKDLRNVTFSIDNLTTNQSTSNTIKASHLPCTMNAGWMVEDNVANGGLATFANFTPVTFADAVVRGPGGEKYGPKDGMIVEMVGGSSALLPAYVSSIDVDTVTIERGFE